MSMSLLCECGTLAPIEQVRTQRLVAAGRTAAEGWAAGALIIAISPAARVYTEGTNCHARARIWACTAQSPELDHTINLSVLCLLQAAR